jgi:poly(hydroxyalkanoate) granule-associated protein
MNEAQTNPAVGAADRLNQVRIAGRKLWLAGLGAVGTLAELDRESRGLFDRLVERGRPLEERQKKVMDEWGDRAAEKLREVSERARGQVRQDLKRVLVKAGVPTADEWNALTARLEALSLSIDELARTDAQASNHV